MQKIDLKNVGMLLLRVILGVTFFMHGWDKFQHMQGVIGFFGTLGLAPFFAYLVTWVEMLGGVALVVGVLSNYAAYLLSVIMLVATFMVKWKMGFLGGYEFDLVLLFSLLAVAWNGSGPYSLSGKLCGCGDCAMCGASLLCKKKSEPVSPEGNL